MHPIFERLKERKIVQWALAYAAGAVALYSALDAFAEPWRGGDLQLRITQLGLLVGLFLAITLAWYHGGRGEQRVIGVELLILAGIMGLGAIAVRLVTVGPADDLPSPAVVEWLPTPFLRDDEPTRIGWGAFRLRSDGAALAYRGRATSEEDVSLLVRRWEAIAAEVVPGTEGAFHPALSADGGRIAFAQGFPDYRLWAGPVDGVRHDLGQALGPIWSPDGVLYASDGGGVFRVP